MYNRTIIPILILLACSCSTTRVLKEGEYCLVQNKITLTGNNKISTGEIEKHIQQKSMSSGILGWNPLVGIYNLAGNEKEGRWNNFVRKIGTKPVIFDESSVSFSEDNIKRHLEYIGYYNSSVKGEISKKDKKVRVNYKISPGKRYKIRSITHILPDFEEFKNDFKKDTASITIKKGSFLSESLLEKESERGAAYFRNSGYNKITKSNYSFVADTNRSDGTVSLEMKISHINTEDGSLSDMFNKSKFGKVNIYYPCSFKFRPGVLKKLNTIKPGMIYSDDAVNTTYDRLSSIRIFNGVNIALDSKENNVVDCDINLTPSKLQGFKLNLEGSTTYSRLLGLSPGLSYYNKNIFRGGEWFNLSFIGNFQFKPKEKISSTEFGISSSISIPGFLLLPSDLFKNIVPRSEYSISYNYQNRPEYMRNIISTSLGYVGTHKKLYYQIYPLRLKIVRLSHVDAAFYKSLEDNPFMKNSYQNHFDIGSGAILYFTDNTDVIPKGSYYFIRLQIDVAGNSMNLFKKYMKTDANGSGLIWGIPFSQFVRAELNMGKTWRFGKKQNHAIATRILFGAGYAYGNSHVLPFDQHFYSGGANSLRGWQARTVGPGFEKPEKSFLIPNQTGDMKFETNIEYRFNLFWKFAGALFLDAGNVWTYHETGKNNNNYGKPVLKTIGESIASSWGTGLRLDLNFLLLRLDVGMKIHDPSRDHGRRWLTPEEWLQYDGYAINFGVGYPF